MAQLIEGPRVQCIKDDTQGLFSYVSKAPRIVTSVPLSVTPQFYLATTGWINITVCTVCLRVTFTGESF